MKTNSYTRFLELILLYNRTCVKDIYARTFFKHNDIGLSLCLELSDLSNDEQIVTYEHATTSRITVLSEISEFNEIIDRITKIIKIKEHNNKYVSVCPNCKTIKLDTTQKHYLCIDCLSKMNNIEICKESFLDGCRQFVYLIVDSNTRRLKIGNSNDPDKRLKTLQTGSPTRLEMISYFPGNEKIERKLHKEFSDIRLIGEWFDYDEKIVKVFQEMTYIQIKKKYKSYFKIY